MFNFRPVLLKLFLFKNQSNCSLFFESELLLSNQERRCNGGVVKVSFLR